MYFFYSSLMGFICELLSGRIKPWWSVYPSHQWIVSLHSQLALIKINDVQTWIINCVASICSSCTTVAVSRQTLYMLVFMCNESGLKRKFQGEAKELEGTRTNGCYRCFLFFSGTCIVSPEWVFYLSGRKRSGVCTWMNSTYRQSECVLRVCFIQLRPDVQTLSTFVTSDLFDSSAVASSLFHTRRGS